MDIYEYLKLDHQEVSALFKQFNKSRLLARRKQIVALISQELLVHAQSEQETFYKALQEYETTKDKALHGKKEHQEIEDQINLILHTKTFNEEWVKKVKHLKKLVTHHVREEEGPIFRRAKKVLSDEDAYILKEQMHYLKQHLLLSMHKKEAQEHAKAEGTTPHKKVHHLHRKGQEAHRYHKKAV